MINRNDFGTSVKMIPKTDCIYTTNTQILEISNAMMVCPISVARGGVGTNGWMIGVMSS